TVRVWDAQTGQPVGEPFIGHTGCVYSVAFSPDGTQIVSGSADNTIRIWDTTATWDGRTIDVDSESSSHITVSKTITYSSLADNLCHQSSWSAVPPFWKIKDGWVYSHSSQLLFWLPSQYRSGFWLPRTKLIIGGQTIGLSYSHFMHGPEWT
ncbi:hypothetical protein C8R44DRAFT_536505, partial [Mycena epipterygia]